MKPALLMGALVGLALLILWIRLFAQRVPATRWMADPGPWQDAYDEPVQPWGELCARPSSPLSRLQ